jgi:hypothetical protein
MNGFLGFVHYLVFQQPKNTMFQKLDLFLSSDKEEDTYSAGSPRKS